MIQLAGSLHFTQPASRVAGYPETHCRCSADQPMIADFLTRPYVCAIIGVAVILFLAVDELEPNRRVAFILQCAILVTGGGVIANQLMS